VKRSYLSKVHYSLSSVFKTVNLILGMPQLNQYDAGATDLRDIFTGKPDFTPYDFTPIVYAKGANAIWLAMTKGIDFSKPDADELKLRAAIMKSEGLPRKVSGHDPLLTGRCEIKTVPGVPFSYGCDGKSQAGEATEACASDELSGPSVAVIWRA
jgi:hypothetical protein